MTNEERVRRAQRADMLAQDDLFKDAIAKLRDDAMEKFKAAQTQDDFLKARAQYDVTESFLNVFIGLVRDGQMAQERIDRAKPKVKPGDQFVPRHSQFNS